MTTTGDALCLQDGVVAWVDVMNPPDDLIATCAVNEGTAVLGLKDNVALGQIKATFIPTPAGYPPIGSVGTIKPCDGKLWTITSWVTIPFFGPGLPLALCVAKDDPVRMIWAYPPGSTGVFEFTPYT